MFTSYATLTNVIISNNNGVSGGGIYNDDAYLVLTNTTVCYNSGGIGSGLFNINFASAIFRNCIVWDTSSNSIDTLMSITGYWNSLVKGVSALGVLDMDPLFADAANGNYRLTHSSPAVNTGNNAFYNSGNTPDLSHITTDLDGNPRIFNRTVDLGAYEFQSISDIIPDDSGIVYVNKHVTTGNGTGDSWYNAAIELADGDGDDGTRRRMGAPPG